MESETAGNMYGVSDLKISMC